MLLIDKAESGDEAAGNELMASWQLRVPKAYFSGRGESWHGCIGHVSAEIVAVDKDGLTIQPYGAVEGAVVVVDGCKRRRVYNTWEEGRLTWDEVRLGQFGKHGAQDRRWRW